MTVAVNDVLRVTAKMELAGEDIINVYWYKHVGAGSVTDSAFHTAVTSDLDTAYTAIAGQMPTTLLFTTIESWNVTQDTPIAETAWPVLTAGTGTGDRLPGQVSALVTFPTNTARSLGKKYLGVFTEGANDAFGQPVAALQTALATYAAAILNGVLVSGESFVVGHYRTATATFISWVAALVETTWATQRRRKKGTGS